MKSYKVTFEDPNPEVKTIAVQAANKKDALIAAQWCMDENGDTGWIHNHTNVVPR